MIELWPLLTIAIPGFIAWGDLRARVSALRKDMDTKASKETLDHIDTRLTRMEDKLDRVLERS